MQRLKLVWDLLKGSRTLYIFAIASVGIATFFSFMSPFVLRTTIDSVIGKKPLGLPMWASHLIRGQEGVEWVSHHLWMAGLMLVLISACASLFQYMKGRFSAQASERFVRVLRERLYDHLQRLPFSYHAKAETGDLVQRCTSDVDTIRRFLAVQLVEVGRAVFMLTLSIPIMLYLNVRMTLMSMTIIPVIFAFAVMFFVKVKAAFKIADEAEGSLTTVLQEAVSGIRVVRAFARQDYELDKFEMKNEDMRNKIYWLIKLLAWYWGVSDFLCMTQIGIVLLIGAFYAIGGQITLGTLIVFTTYEGMMLWPIRQMGRVLTDMGKAMVSLNRVNEILSQPLEEVEGTTTLEENHKFNGELEFRKLSFGYSDEHLILKDVNFHAKAGQTIAILGATGSGKSTLVNLIPRLYDYHFGSILLDGIELNTIDRHLLRKQVGIVLQEPYLYSKTVKENISMANSEAADETIYDVASVASVHDAILAFDQGYETPVGEKGVTLSGGQKQRVAIARAILQDAAILIFDDSLSAVDTETDRKIQAGLKARKGKATTFIISHRLTTLSQADQILVLEKGTIVESGTHEELLAYGGVYQRIWNLQNNLDEEIELGIRVEEDNSELGNMIPA
ncbi:MAG TPA: ABC transporter ATP-binding protein, partial [Candidatus Cloacimonadota bacterium]|nr:ABC transporter ATP-binding protein [Candidatus Cloacimonadota bacterium]